MLQELGLSFRTLWGEIVIFAWFYLEVAELCQSKGEPLMNPGRILHNTKARL